MKRYRFYYFCSTVMVIVLGLLSRRISSLPLWLGDSLWAAMVYLGFRFLAPQEKSHKTVLASLLFSFGIEFSQIIQWSWLNDIRQTSLGHLVLGQGFLWSDLLAYTFGILVVSLLDYGVINRKITG